MSLMLRLWIIFIKFDFKMWCKYHGYWPRRHKDAINWVLRRTLNPDKLQAYRLIESVSLFPDNRKRWM